MLHRAALAGVAIPSGVVVRDGDYAAWCVEGYPLPDDLRLSVLAVRSAFSTEDNPRLSHAGMFDSVLRVAGDDSRAIAAAAAQVRE